MFASSQLRLPFAHELIVDLFAGGGGVSVAIRKALGRDPDVAVNHDPDAIDMHTVNHPNTRHYLEDVYRVDPLRATRGVPVGLLHASPDCTDHSQAKSGQPRRVEIRSLSWVVLKWAAQTKPRCITLENVEQILKWSPLVAKRDRTTGRVIKIDRTVAAPGERVPVRDQFLVPCKHRTGKHWRQFITELRRMGYAVQWRSLTASDYGAGTSRTRLFLMARRDGLPICWPKATHGKGKRLRPTVTAADCIDFSIPCPSIFTRPKPLAPATLRRIAKGVQRYVIDSADPFIVSLAHGDSGGRREYPMSDPLGTLHAGGGKFAVVSPTIVPVTHSGSDRNHDVSEPLRTITTAHRGEFMLAGATLIQTSYGERPGQSPRVPHLEKPLGTIVAGGIKHAAVAAFMEQANGGFYDGDGRDMRQPVSTIAASGGSPRQRLVAASLVTLRKNMVGSDARDPMRTITSGAEHHAVVEYQLSPEAESGALRVAAFLIRYYSFGGQHGDLREPLSTITTRDRLALVTVTIRGTPYVIVDIGLRMITPPELFLAQGFPATYKITHRPDGRPFTKTALVKLVGNSVSPPPYESLLLANFGHERMLQEEVA